MKSIDYIKYVFLPVLIKETLIKRSFLIFKWLWSSFQLVLLCLQHMVSKVTMAKQRMWESQGCAIPGCCLYHSLPYDTGQMIINMCTIITLLNPSLVCLPHNKPIIRRWDTEARNGDFNYTMSIIKKKNNWPINEVSLANQWSFLF